MKIDRQYQLQLLQTLLNEFPIPINLNWPENESDETYIKEFANIEYLRQKGLLEANPGDVDENNRAIIKNLKITAHGIDWLQENITA